MGSIHYVWLCFFVLLRIEKVSVVPYVYITSIDALAFYFQGFPLLFHAVFRRVQDCLQQIVVQKYLFIGFFSLFCSDLNDFHDICQFSMHVQRLAEEILERWSLASFPAIDPFFTNCLHLLTVNLGQRCR